LAFFGLFACRDKLFLILTDPGFGDIRKPSKDHCRIRQSTTLEETALANHKSAIKRNRQAAVRTIRNTHIRSTMRTLVKQVRTAAADGDVETAKQALARAIPCIDKAATKGVIHKSTASRKVSRLQKLVTAMA
jgi:small subunit ribosomal protein S20